MNLRQIEVFRAVMRAGTLSGAAEVLHVSQPAVSRLIRYLESKLQVALFERSGGRLHPTPEAMALMREIDSAWRSIDRVKMYAEQLRHGVSDTLRICTNLSPALDLLPRAVAELKRRMPGLHIAMEIATQTQITEQLLTGECDIGVAAFVQHRHPALTHHLIGEGNVLCVMAADHPLAMRTQLKLEEIQAYDVISFGTETAHGKVVEALLGSSEALRKATVDVRYAYIACSVAVHGWGIALVDDLTVAGFKDPRLVAVPLAQSVRYGAYAMSSAERPPSAGGREIVNLLQLYWKEACRTMNAQTMAQ
ncbi:LysR family transcriptional regulator [Herbaspirillum sp. C9C3]|uniref:LysR family transcriptional regulator n=1 Tax=Herbaspirillum sp. C9C3 TaxID=2735271 RepID=UPI0015859131|nr:LysR family transcriptional regulator [Herbaspirillum sp. C9C3]NUT61387.1 LysR family transcriptional regulator [Herbaspirillum sp. C9C3]